METTVIKNQKTVQEIEQEVLAYLNKTAKHLFLTEDKYFFKVMPIKVNDNWYNVIIKFNGDKCFIQINSVKRGIDYYNTNAKNVIKNELFPQHLAPKSTIKNFKLMKEKMVEVIKLIQTKYTGDDMTIKNGISEILKGVSPKV